MHRSTPAFGLLLLATISGPALGAEPSLQDAALNAAVAAKCRAQLGDEALFDAAFAQLEAVAASTAGGPSGVQLAEYRQQLIATTPAAQEPMIPEMCAALRKAIQP